MQAADGSTGRAQHIGIGLGAAVLAFGGIYTIGSIAGKVLRNNPRAFSRRTFAAAAGVSIVTGIVAGTKAARSTGRPLSARESESATSSWEEAALEGFDLKVASKDPYSRFVAKLVGKDLLLADQKTGTVQRIESDVCELFTSGSGIPFVLRDPDTDETFIARACAKDPKSVTVRELYTASDNWGFFKTKTRYSDMSDLSDLKGDRPITLLGLVPSTIGPLALLQCTARSDAKAKRTRSRQGGVVYAHLTKGTQEEFRGLRFDPERDVIAAGGIMQVRDDEYSFRIFGGGSKRTSPGGPPLVAAQLLDHPTKSQQIAIWDRSGRIYLHEPRKGIRVATVSTGVALDETSRFLLHPEADHLLLVAAGDTESGALRVYNTKSRKLLSTICPLRTNSPIRAIQLIGHHSRDFQIRLVHDGGHLDLPIGELLQDKRKRPY